MGREDGERREGVRGESRRGGGGYKEEREKVGERGRRETRLRMGE